MRRRMIMLIMVITGIVTMVMFGVKASVVL